MQKTVYFFDKHGYPNFYDNCDNPILPHDAETIKLCLNTDTATEIFDYWNGLSRSDFNYEHHILYKTNDYYFIYGQSGAKGEFSEYLGNTWRGPGYGFKLLTQADAIRFVEENMSACESFDKYEKFFK